MSRIDRTQKINPISKAPGAGGGFDPYLVASALSGNGQNPFQAFAGELTQKITALFTMRKNMQAAETRLDQMKAQIERVEGQIAEVNHTDTGQRLNKLR